MWALGNAEKIFTAANTGEETDFFFSDSILPEDKALTEVFLGVFLSNFIDSGVIGEGWPPLGNLDDGVPSGINYQALSLYTGGAESKTPPFTEFGGDTFKSGECECWDGINGK